MLARLLALALFASLLALVACGDDGGSPTVTPKPVSRGPALQIFLREAYEKGLFLDDDPIEITIEEMLYDDAARAATEYGLGLYATATGDPPYPDGLPGYLITAQGQFFYYEDEERSPAPDTPRRPAVATGFVDTQGRMTYAWRFID